MKKNSMSRALKFILFVTVLSIPLSAFFDGATIFMDAVPWFLGIFIVIFIVLFGAFFDMIGVASAAADEPPFHAMASKRIHGAKFAIKIVRNAERVASICSDVIGDIAGVLSGATALAVGESMAHHFGVEGGYKEIFSIGLTVLATSLTIGAKAFGKTVAVYYPTTIILFAARVSWNFVRFFEREKNNEKRVTVGKKGKRKKSDPDV
jgi:CBS domain containing-hemolysin-like protein